MADNQRTGGGFMGGGLLDELVVRITVDLTGFRRGIAEAIAEIRTLRGAIAGQVGGVSLGDAMTAALVTPMIVATARIGQVRNEMRLLAQEARNIAMITSGGPAPGGRSMGALIVPGGGAPVIDARRAQFATRGSGGRMRRTYEAGGSDDLMEAAGGVVMVPPLGPGESREDRYRRRYGFSPEAAERYRRRYGREPPNRMAVPGPFDEMGRWFGLRVGAFGRREGARTRDAFETARENAPGYGEAVDNLGGASRNVGAAGRRVAGSRIASMLGLVGLGALFGDLLRLAASLATVIAGTLTGAFAALLTPLGAVVALITALVALFVAANWDSFKAFWEWFSERWTQIIAGEGMGDVVSGWRNLMGAFRELWDTVRTIFRDDSGSITSILMFFGEIVIRTVNAAMEALGGFLNMLGELVRAVAAMIRGDWADVWNHMGEAVRLAFRTLLNTLGSLFPEIQARIDTFATWVERRFADMGRAIAQAFGGADDRISPTQGGRMLRSAGDKDAARGRYPANDNKNWDRTRATRGRGAGVDAFRDFSVFAGMENAVTGGDEGWRAQQEQHLQRMSRLADDFGYSISSAFEAAVTSGAKFSDILRSLIYDLAAMTLRAAVIEPMAQSFASGFRGLFGAGGGGGGGGGSKGGSGFMSTVASVVGSMFGGFFADGGFLKPGQWGVVGERGPEIAFGGRSGMSIQPNGAGGGMAYNDNRVFDLRGASVEAVQRLERALEADRASFDMRMRASYANMRQRGYAA